jgi:hypothetical protein
VQFSSNLFDTNTLFARKKSTEDFSEVLLGSLSSLLVVGMAKTHANLAAR